MLSEAQRRELLGLGLLALTLFVLLSLVPLGLLGGVAGRFPSGNLMGPLGRVLETGGVRLLGAGVFLLPLLPGLGGAVAFGWLEPGRALRAGILATGLALLLPVALALPAVQPPVSSLAYPLGPPPPPP
ncbi:MAG TPA: hypothetical protein VMK65_10575, partial [Longimicrobiales bacterium]|nr:hypothetical protein [Longimicrobiales bacterium]